MREIERRNNSDREHIWHQKKPIPGRAELIMAGSPGSSPAPARELPVRNKPTQI